MRLVLIHGRSQGGKDADVLERTWTGALARGVRACGLDPIGDRVEIRFPFYGDVLDELTAGRRDLAATPRGADDAVDAFRAALLAEVAERAGVTSSDVVAELGEPVSERGARNTAWAQATGRAVERRAPWLAGGVLSTLLADVDTYLRRPAARRRVDTLVGAAIREYGGPVVVVGHSLGSVVAYNVLDTIGDTVTVPLLVTLGSPLGLRQVQRHLRHPLGMPAGVARWFNGADERDPVALYSRLDRDVFPADIDNVSDTHNRPSDAPSIEDYLGDGRVSRTIATALAS